MLDLDLGTKRHRIEFQGKDKNGKVIDDAFLLELKPLNKRLFREAEKRYTEKVKYQGQWIELVDPEKYKYELRKLLKYLENPILTL